jgi:DnaJ-class molecular chaperone
MGIPLGGGKRGDLFAVVAITVPEAPDSKEKALWEAIAAAHGG